MGTDWKIWTQGTQCFVGHTHTCYGWDEAVQLGDLICLIYHTSSSGCSSTHSLDQVCKAERMEHHVRRIHGKSRSHTADVQALRSHVDRLEKPKVKTVHTIFQCSSSKLHDHDAAYSYTETHWHSSCMLLLGYFSTSSCPLEAKTCSVSMR